MTTPRFLYFDLGNVLLFFDHEIACQNAASLLGRDVDAVRRLIFGGSLQEQYETGLISDEEFHTVVCRELDVECSLESLKLAVSDIFALNVSIIPILSQLWRGGCRMGILSNTCNAHWEFVHKQRYQMLFDFFERSAVSFELKAMKPSASIYHSAAELAGVTPQEIFFVDDKPENVAGANEAGYDAVLYTDTVQLTKDLLQRGLAV